MYHTLASGAFTYTTTPTQGWFKTPPYRPPRRTGIPLPRASTLSRARLPPTRPAPAAMASAPLRLTGGVVGVVPAVVTALAGVALGVVIGRGWRRPAAAPASSRRGAGGDGSASASDAGSDGDGSDGDADEDEDSDDGEDSSVVPPGVELKMVLCVRGDLAMSKGKVAAQCSHAALACYRGAARACPEYVKAWLYRGQTKVTLKLDDEAQMDAVAAAARAAGIVCCVIEDAGRTEVEPGTRTVLGLGPAPKAAIDALTGPRGSVDRKSVV